MFRTVSPVRTLGAQYQTGHTTNIQRTSVQLSGPSKTKGSVVFNVLRQFCEFWILFTNEQARRYMSVCLVTWQQTRIRIPFLFYSSVIIFVIQNTQTNTGTLSASYSLSIRTSPTRMKVEHSFRLCNKVKNKYRVMPYYTICLQGMHKNKFILHSYQQNITTHHHNHNYTHQVHSCYTN